MESKKTFYIIYIFITTLILYHNIVFIYFKMIYIVKSLYNINYKAKIYNKNKLLYLKVQKTSLYY